jgi:short-subunit dehydrogenase
LETVRIEEAQQQFDVNVWGVVRVLQAVLPGMRQRRFGHILNISSTSGIRGVPCFDFYTGSKFALEGICDSMRYSLAPFNISVTMIEPGPVRTKFADRLVDTTGTSTATGRGTRELAEHDTESVYYHRFTDKMIESLNKRMQVPEEAQSSEEVAQVLVNLVEKKLVATALTDVPFNVGPGPASQSLIEGLRVHPTGWGGLYSTYLNSVPPLKTLLPDA